MDTLRFPDGARMPILGLGTWKSAPGEVHGAVVEALRLGYRHLDCAAIYGNEAEIGAAIAEAIATGLVRRDELWITSKLWNDCHAPADVRPALERTLADLRLDHLDLYLVHWPVALKRGVTVPETAAQMVSLDDLPLAETWTAVEALVDAGLCRHIGVSNFSARKVATLLDGARIAPAMNQVEMHPYLQQPELLASCRARGVHVTAYSPLGSPDRPAGLRTAGEPVLLEEPVIAEVARGRGATPAQVLMAWAVARGTAVIPKSVSPARLRENLGAASLRLTADDIAALDRLDRHRRYVDGAFWALPGAPYTLQSLWDE